MHCQSILHEIQKPVWDDCHHRDKTLSVFYSLQLIGWNWFQDSALWFCLQWFGTFMLCYGGCMSSLPMGFVTAWTEWPLSGGRKKLKSWFWFSFEKQNSRLFFRSDPTPPREKPPPQPPWRAEGEKGRGGASEYPPIAICGRALTDKPMYPMGVVTEIGGATRKGAGAAPPIGRRRGRSITSGSGSARSGRGLERCGGRGLGRCGGVACPGVFKPGAVGFVAQSVRRCGGRAFVVCVRCLFFFFNTLFFGARVYAEGARPGWARRLSEPVFISLLRPVRVRWGISSRPAPGGPSPSLSLSAGGSRRFPLDASPQPQAGGGRGEALPPRIYRRPAPSSALSPSPRALRCRPGALPPLWTRDICPSWWRRRTPWTRPSRTPCGWSTKVRGAAAALSFHPSALLEVSAETRGAEGRGGRTAWICSLSCGCCWGAARLLSPVLLEGGWGWFPPALLWFGVV